ncbi:MAG: response regulator [Planctomycetota bacterium]
MASPDARILIVDDCEINRKILQKLLRKEYTLECAVDGEDCLRKVEAFDPRVVLLDVMMPGLDGYEVCRQVKSAAANRFRQVILLSGRGTAAERLRGYECLADDYLVKPFDHDELVWKVRVQFRLWEQFCSSGVIASSEPSGA